MHRYRRGLLAVDQRFAQRQLQRGKSLVAQLLGEFH